MKLRFVAGLLVMLAVYSALHLYIGWQGWIFLSHLLGWRHPAVYGIVFGIIAFSYLIARLPARILPYPASAALRWIGSYWMAVFFYALLLLPLADAAFWLLRLKGTPKDSAVLWIGAAVLAALTVLIAYGSRNAWSPYVRKIEITLPKQAGGMKELRVAAASDLHLGVVVRNKHLRRLIRQVGEIKPDLILLPGDVIDDVIEPFIRYRMADTMKELTARYGVFAVLGNHEYYGGHIGEYVKRMEAIGIHVLQDEAVRVNDSFTVVGRKDRTAETMDPAGRLPLKELLSEVDHSLPILLMDHQPYHLEQAAENGVDILLAGHTHRGQMAPNHWITRKIFELDWGYLQKGQLHAVVSSGFGLWGPPIRIGSRSEIIDIHIRFQPE